MNKCDKCGGLHWRTAPCIQRKESTASGKDRIVGGIRKDQASGANPVTSAAKGSRRFKPDSAAPAGTQALPVDTNPRVSRASADLATPPAGVGADKDRPKFDKVAFQRKYMREVYRPRLKAKKAALASPKPL